MLYEVTISFSKVVNVSADSELEAVAYAKAGRKPGTFRVESIAVGGGDAFEVLAYCEGCEKPLLLRDVPDVYVTDEEGCSTCAVCMETLGVV